MQRRHELISKFEELSRSSASSNKTHRFFLQEDKLFCNEGIMRMQGFSNDLIMVGEERLMTINQCKALYIKLGKEDEYVKECIYSEQPLLKLGYEEIDHDNCLKGDWEKVRTKLVSRKNNDTGAITDHIRQIRLFYEAGDNVLWITFHANLLWWCFSKREITLLPQNTKVRPVIDKWSCNDIKGDLLQMDQLSSSLTSVHAYRGTICTVKASKYLFDKINGIITKEIEDIQAKLSELEKKLEIIINNLHWKDFEILIDLIFRQAGWQRVSILGDTQKSLDLVLLSPITAEKYGVQVKSRASLEHFKKFQSDCHDMQGYSKFYFVVHNSSPELKNIKQDNMFELILSSKIAHLVVKHGLTEWIISKGG